MDDRSRHSLTPIDQIEKGQTYFRALDLEVEHFGPLWHLIKIAQLLDTELSRIAASHGISIADFHLLSAVMMESDAAPCANDLAMKLNLSNAALSLRIRKLERLAAIERKENPADRRQALLTILPKGEDLVRQVGKSLEDRARFMPWFKELRENDRVQLAALLGDLHLRLHRDFEPARRRRT